MLIFNSLNFISSVRRLKAIENDGVQWICPDYRYAGADKIVVNRDDLKADILNLGKSLLEKMPQNYYPGRYQHALEFSKRGYDENREFLNNEFSVFKGGKELVVFFEKYGLPSSQEVFEADYNGRKKHDLLIGYMRKAHINYMDYVQKKGIYAPTGHEWDVAYAWPAAVLADIVVEIFMLAARTGDIPAMMQNAPHDTIECASNISYTITFSVSKNGYERSCHTTSLFDYAALLILHDPSVSVRECPNCGKVFIPANQRASYCSESCRNSAAAKRSQAKRKARERESENG